MLVIIKTSSKLTRIWETDLVSSSHNYRIPEKTGCFKTRLKKYLQLTANFLSKILLQVYNVFCPKLACFHRSWLKTMRKFRAQTHTHTHTHTLNLNVCRIMKVKHLCQSLFLCCRVENYNYIKKKPQHRCICILHNF